METERSLIGRTDDGKEVSRFTLTNKMGLRASVTDLGATWLGMEVPDREGEFKDVLLGYDTVAMIYENPGSLGAIIGRNANRIKDAEFELKGKRYKLCENNGKNNLHSGPDTLNKRMFKTEIRDDSIVFSLHSPKGDQGFPGELDIKVIYSLTDEGCFNIDYVLTAGKEDTIANFTCHPYFNLAGHDSGYALKQEVFIDADFITENDSSSVPTGRLIDVKGTAFDFRERKAIDRDIEEDHIQLKYGGGYDHNFCINKGGTEKPCAGAYDPESGRSMEIYTDCEGIQFYTGNGLSGKETGKGGARYQRRGGYAFETQFYPNAINIPTFRQPVLRAFETFESRTVYKFFTV